MKSSNKALLMDSRSPFTVVRGRPSPASRASFCPSEVVTRPIPLRPSRLFKSAAGRVDAAIRLEPISAHATSTAAMVTRSLCASVLAPPCAPFAGAALCDCRLVDGAMAVGRGPERGLATFEAALSSSTSLWGMTAAELRGRADRAVCAPGAAPRTARRTPPSDASPASPASRRAARIR
eukprot:CAMPEP_0176082930 /NCGR_PEP_ID=MMETSP0120_2-20121206/41485_1 /TAXON_ID=160619 /ORGANISM="Kryptoperidinium foliaceum, Strain CCMP 1326" /LENGTH=178 /DNA_ID=CAMNT_0017416703 /DNA_START=218 /DNA_END=754 /DNA_ORIENTATION=+